jgi:hypothetical protein
MVMVHEVVAACYFFGMRFTLTHSKIDLVPT